METYITICKIDRQWEFAVQLRELKQGLCINLDGWDGEGDGKEVQKRGNICIPMADSCWGLTENRKFYKAIQFSSVQSLSRVRLCDHMNRSRPGLPVHHQLPEFTQTQVHRVSDAIQPSHPLSSPSPPAPSPSQHQSLFQWVNSLASLLLQLPLRGASPFPLPLSSPLSFFLMSYLWGVFLSS